MIFFVYNIANSTKYCAEILQKVRWAKVANKLKYYREKAQLTQQELAERADVSRNTISALETQDNVNVTYDIMNKLANALELKVPTIFF